MKLLIAIPALNEEASIGSVIQQTLDARAAILARTGVTAVGVTVVSDGSTDRTVERATAFCPDIHLIVFEQNRGYGAAIMEAWRQSDADLLAFLDADGTCDPRAFVELCSAVLDGGAEMALGSRVHAASRMSPVRRLGNAVFAMMLTAFGSTRVRDAASGMRVVRRDCLPRLMPLPDGLHFTPAMSAQAILSNNMNVAEVEVPYAARTGRSKLHPVRDAWRFTRVILAAAILYRPSRALGLLAMLAFAAAAGWTARLAWQFYVFGELQLFMMYHFVVIQLSTTAGLLLLTAGHLADKAVGITLSTEARQWQSRGLLGPLLSHRLFWLLPAALVAIGALAIGPAVTDYIRTAHIDAAKHHWSRFFTMSFAFSLALILTSVRLIDITLDLLAARVAFLRSGVVISSDTAAHPGRGTRA